MNGFKLLDGDLEIVNGEIATVIGDELKAQTIQQVLSTNKGEWLFDEDEGINFKNILGKESADFEIISRDEFSQGISQVDDTLTLDQYERTFDSKTRKMVVKISAKTESDGTIAISTEY